MEGMCDPLNPILMLLNFWEVVQYVVIWELSESLEGFFCKLLDV